jgi:AbrB family transcriptional regulator, transcriptional pleiotropic regulator of transition state genes
MCRKIDELGRIVLPKELRDTLGVNNKDGLEIFVNENQIVLKKYQPGCIFCNQIDDVKLYKGYSVCPECQSNLQCLA